MASVVVVPHDLRWADAFSAESIGIARALGPNLLELHHIGSTSIAGIYAKPVIDMMAVVDDVAALDGPDLLTSLGYQGRGEYGIAGRRFFYRTDSDGRKTHQVHAFGRGSPHIARHLAFRDFLRAHGDIALEYSDLKRRLAELHPDDIEAYMDGKDGFIKEMEARALGWAAV